MIKRRNQISPSAIKTSALVKTRREIIEITLATTIQIF
jgi:hypothetical protein